jgi:hypothetical protein
MKRKVFSEGTYVHLHILAFINASALKEKNDDFCGRNLEGVERKQNFSKQVAS